MDALCTSTKTFTVNEICEALWFFLLTLLGCCFVPTICRKKKQSAGSVLQKTCSEKFHESTQLGGMKSTKMDSLTVYFLCVLKKQQSWCSMPVSFLKRYYNGSVFLCFFMYFSEQLLLVYYRSAWRIFKPKFEQKIHPGKIS